MEKQDTEKCAQCIHLCVFKKGIYTLMCRYMPRAFLEEGITTRGLTLS